MNCHITSRRAFLGGMAGIAAAKPNARIKAFCIDFNWGPGGPNDFAGPGVFASASAKQHFRWYREMAVNTIQTFCVSCIGYSWYRGSVAPVMPGMQGDFLKEITHLAHGAGMRSTGYFCVGANTWWGQHQPRLSHGAPSAPHIPLTTEYLDYLCREMEDALKTVEIDGYMIDWVWNVKPRWIECERRMYRELMGEPFPGVKQVTAEQTGQFGRRAVDRAWGRIRDAAKSVRPEVILWLTCNNLRDPQVTGSRMLREIDWLMNEHPDPASLEETRRTVGPHPVLIQTICGWGDQHNAAKLMRDPRCNDAGLYGFAKPDTGTTLPPDDNSGNARNIAIMRRAFQTL